MDSAYRGAANLEVMRQAVNYNAFLLSLVLSFARSGEPIVDFGAGLGTFAVDVRRRGFSVTCVEPDQEQASVIGAAGLPVLSALADLPDKSADYLYSLNVLEHIEDDLATLRECRAKLRVGGRMLVYVPAMPILYSSMDTLVGHYRRYTRRELCRKLAASGFRVIESRYADCLGVPASLAFKAVGRRDGSLSPISLRAYDRLFFPASRAGDSVLGRVLGKNVYAVGARIGY